MPMFVAINRLRCPASYAEHLERAFRHAGNLQGVQGFVSFRFLRNTREGEPLEYLAETTWESRAAYEAWTRSESFARAHRAGDGDSPLSASLETYEDLA
jgi:heme-degrading monooxygenase HmoA